MPVADLSPFGYHPLEGPILAYPLTPRSMSPVRCTCCGQMAAVFDFFYYLWRDRRWEIYRCASCTHQFVYPSVTKDDQDVIYGDQYFTKQGDWAAGHFDSYEQSETELRDEARKILAMIPVKTGRLLDIGCAGGVFMDEAWKQGFEVEGIEYNATMAERARGIGFTVITGAIESIPLSTFGPEFNVVVMLDVLEHLPDPRAAIERVGAWSKPSSTLFIRGPLANSRIGKIKETLRRIVRKPKQLPGYPLDANMWNTRSLSHLVGTEGFTPRRWIGNAEFSNLLAERP